MKNLFLLLPIAFLSISNLNAQKANHDMRFIRVANGQLEGVNESGVFIFKGIPFAKPPVGTLRWKEPQPAENWSGIRKADKFGPRPMQRFVFTDMKFRSDSVSEDCLYLNVWTPAKSPTDHLPVLVYFYGGGFIAGGSSEYRYDGESMARRGVIAVTVNYRLGVFGFLAHPELTKESPHHASGNYGLLDQAAALKWIQKNIAAFGGDPTRITIGGESAGSFSVSALMASPLSRNIIAGAIGESGSLLAKSATVSLSDAETVGEKFAKNIGATSLADLRNIPAEQLLQETAKPGNSRFPVDVDGYFLPKSPVQIYTAGEQAHVPLLVGWNSEEGNYRSIIGNESPTVENYKNAIEKRFGENAAKVLTAFNATDSQTVKSAGTELASALFIAFGTWKWSDLQSKTGNKPVYRYFYKHPRPALASALENSRPSAEGAVHSSEIEYALGNLPTNRVYNWQPEDYKISEIFQTFFANFIKTGNPNGLGVPEWPAVKSGGPAEVMNIDVDSKAEKEKHRNQFLALEDILMK